MYLGGKIRIYASHPDGEDLSPITERSDGFRIFIAMLAHIKKHDMSSNNHPPILLIDEIENHLHYNAQSNLINFLSEQKIASQIIYTTHSPGSLPNSLIDIRAVERDGTDSKIVNRMWSNNRLGYKRLFWLMGAANYAFSSMRRIVICEGESDFILYPDILGEIDEKWRKYQFLPGFAVISKPSEFLDEAVKNLYIFDGHRDGKGYARGLKESGVDESSIFLLPDNCVIEDMLDVDKYALAVNEEIRKSNGIAEFVLSSELPDKNRPQYVKDKCARSNIGVPSKRAVAEYLIKDLDDKNLLSQDRIDYFGKLSGEMLRKIE